MPSHLLQRRGIELGSFDTDQVNQSPQKESDWASGKPIFLAGVAHKYLSDNHQAIARSAQLHAHVVSGKSAEKIFDQPYYVARWEKHFEALGSSVNPGAQQEIETLFFDAVEDEDILAEDLWVKLSWLSFVEGDNSLRFRFSFGVDHEEDVAADSKRQTYAAMLAESLFSESRMITQNEALVNRLGALLNRETLQYVERIIYFNAPNGGAYLHHDLERGHAGVVYVQASGQTLWLALAKSDLLAQIQAHVAFLDAQQAWPISIAQSGQQHLRNICSDKRLLSKALDSFNDTALIHLINETPEFIQKLIEGGFSYHLRPGDAIVLPQETGSGETEHNCCWHSVLTIGDQTGEGLSFAIR